MTVTRSSLLGQDQDHRPASPGDQVAGESCRRADAAGGLVHLSAAGVSVVLDCTGTALPRVVHWGAALGKLDDVALGALVRTGLPPVVPNALDAPVPVSLLPEHAVGWAGLPGLQGHRNGRAWSPCFTVRSSALSTSGDPLEQGGTLDVEAVDETAELGLQLQVQLAPSGLLRLHAGLRNLSTDVDYTLDGLVLALPVPSEAGELFDLAGRWSRERSPQRQPFTVGSRVRDNRRGRTGADAPLVLAAGTPGFGFRSGQVWGLHVAWSGNHRTYAERLSSGEAVIGGGELLLPGEVRLAPGKEYSSPELFASYALGLDGLAARFHEHLRARPQHPDRPRPVVLNTWEAVYFDHDLHRLQQLADAAAEVGAERYVLDDGWFRGRRDDHAGLGDWYVDERVWPEGLHPLVDHVRGLSMEFGLWVEPEMVNPDSDLARAHPDWILSTGGRTPPESRFQQVLDLTQPGAWNYILQRLDALLREYDIGYLKWDHNRDLVDAGSGPGGEPAVHEQTLALYRLLDELRTRHPHVEIESCSSGGARVDLGILQRTDRVWASDCIDALERQSIQRWTQQLLPPELVGSHVGSPRSHTTGRTHDLSFRAGTALFGHFGIEWDITRASSADRAELARWVQLYKELRPLLHSGSVVRADHPDLALWVHGVVSADRSEAVFALACLRTPLVALAGRVRLPGLCEQTTYRVELLPPGDVVGGHNDVPVPWLADGGASISGRVLGEVGIQVPSMHPEHLLLLRVTSQ